MECKKALTEADGDLDEGRGAAAHQARRQGEQGREPRRRRRRDRRVLSPTARSARWSRSTARPTSSPRTTTSSRFAQDARRAGRRRATRPTSRRSSRSPLDGETVESARQALVQKIGENMTIRRFKRLQAKGKLALYLHGAQDRRAGRLRGRRGGRQGRRDARRRSPKPASLSTEARFRPDVDRATSARIAAKRAPRNRASRPRSSPRWSRARCNKFLTEVTLLGQPFVKNDKQTVEKMLKREEGQGQRLRVLRRRRRHREEGDDFAAEVRHGARPARSAH